jgi:hypothetical protein
MTGYYDYLYRLIVEWAEREGVEDVEVEAFSDYAIANNVPLRPPVTQKQQTMRDVRRALQTKHYVDEQGNKVRERHAVKIYQPDLPNMPPRIEYINPRTSRPVKMELAMDQSYEGVVNYVRRHAIEKQSYDLNNAYDGKIRDYNYDFTLIAEDARMTGTYKDDDDLDDDLD